MFAGATFKEDDAKVQECVAESDQGDDWQKCLSTQTTCACMRGSSVVKTCLGVRWGRIEAAVCNKCHDADEAACAKRVDCSGDFAGTTFIGCFPIPDGLNPNPKPERDSSWFGTVASFFTSDTKDNMQWYPMTCFLLPC